MSLAGPSLWAQGGARPLGKIGPPDGSPVHLSEAGEDGSSVPTYLWHLEEEVRQQLIVQGEWFVRLQFREKV